MTSAGGGSLTMRVVPTAYLFAPAYPLDEVRQARAVTAAAAWCAATGLELVLSPTITERCPPGGWRPAAERQADLAAGLQHTVLLAARGGYGCLDLLEHLPRPTTWPTLIGYSDLTALQAVWGGPCLYGFMPGVAHGPRAPATAAALWRGEGHTVTGRALRRGSAAGPLTAVCLRVLTGLVGTPWMPDLRGRLLAIEDIDEPPYRLDRDLAQLYHAGALRGLRGLIGGTFPATLPAGYGGPSADEVLTRWAERLEVPALGRIPFGHDPDPITLALGRHSHLVVDDLPRLIQDPAPCAAPSL